MGKSKFLVGFIAALALSWANARSAQTQNPQPNIAVDDKTGAQRVAQAARAQELLKRARFALGGEESLTRIHTLSVSGKLQRYIKYVSIQSPTKVVEKEKTLPGKIEVEFLLPDKFRKRVSGKTMRGFGYSYVEIVNGERAWRNPPLRTISSARDNRVVDVDDFERTIELQARGARQQLTLFSLGWLLQPLPTFPLNFSYVGRLQTYSGPADVILVEGLESFQVFLLLDPKTAQPLSVATTFVESRQPTVIVESPIFFDRKSMIDTFQRARQERRERIKPPQRYEVHLKLSEFRQVAGVSLPHRITTLLNNEVIEDLTFDEFEINRPINPKRFEGQPEPKY
jgi:hypothetical protein